MPGRNRTGPQGQGARTGRGLGDCGETAVNPEGAGFGRGRGMGGGGGMGRGRGQGRGRGFGRSFGPQAGDDSAAVQSQSDLEKEIEDLKKRLKAVEK